MEDRLHDETALDSLSMGKLQCDPEDLPQYLYRVQYPSCNTTLTDEGLHASDTDPISEDDIATFRQSVVDFSTWNRNHKTPYISLFSKREVAEDFALKKAGEIKVIKIDTFRLPGSARVFKLSSVIKTFGIKPVGTAQMSEGIFLCLHHVPAKTVLEAKTRDQVELGRTAPLCKVLHPLSPANHMGFNRPLHRTILVPPQARLRRAEMGAESRDCEGCEC